MNFNKIKISGFKSFVESTELSLQKGLTGIVGPNGCGKSNIVDALKWIMGENSPKEMRGKGMDDVIFNGTSIRPQNDLAEIEIIIDNKSKTAPEIFKDCETIEVKRKIEREKGSTYYINNKIVRAKDVRLLFADASSGPNTTSIVAQGEIHKLIPLCDTITKLKAFCHICKDGTLAIFSKRLDSKNDQTYIGGVDKFKT